MALSRFIPIFALVLVHLAHLSLAQDAESPLLLGYQGSFPWAIPGATWADAIAHPNATFTIGIPTPNLTDTEHGIISDAWNISISVTTDISLAGSSDTSLNQSLVFTGTQLNFVPTFDMTAPTNAELDACIFIGLPGFKSNDSDAIGPIDTTGVNKGQCNFLPQDCQNDLKSAISDVLDKTKSPSCADIDLPIIPDSCGSLIIWNEFYPLSINQSTALKGGVLFEYGDLPHAKGNLTAYTEAVDKIWGIISTWRRTTFNSDGTNFTFDIEQVFNCVQARNIAQGSHNPLKLSTGVSLHSSVIPLLALIICSTVTFLI